jgi:hypothetical protein
MKVERMNEGNGEGFRGVGGWKRRIGNNLMKE